MLFISLYSHPRGICSPLHIYWLYTLVPEVWLFLSSLVFLLERSARWKPLEPGYTYFSVKKTKTKTERVASWLDWFKWHVLFYCRLVTTSRQYFLLWNHLQTQRRHYLSNFTPFRDGVNSLNTTHAHWTVKGSQSKFKICNSLRSYV